MTPAERLAELDRYAARAADEEVWIRDDNPNQADAVHHWGAVVRRVADRLRQETP